VLRLNRPARAGASTGIFTIALALARERGNMVVTDSAKFGYTQGERMTRLLHAVTRLGTPLPGVILALSHSPPRPTDGGSVWNQTNKAFC
jgi:hypothetical protein